MYSYSSSPSYSSSFGNPFSLKSATQMCQSSGKGVTCGSGNNSSRQRYTAQEIVSYAGEPASPNFTAPSKSYQSSSNNWNHGK